MTLLYSDNFDSDTTGSLPAGWTAVSGTWQVGTTAPISGSKSLSCITLVDKQVVLYTAAGFAQADQIVSVDFLYATSATRARPLPMARVSNTSLGAGYIVLIGAAGSDANIAIYKVVAGVYSVISSTPAHGVTLVAGTTQLTLEIRCSGTTIEGRVYVSGGTRPSSPQVSVTDSTSSAGAPGLYNAWATGATQGGFDNFVFADAAGVSAATATTLTGPTSGVIGNASTPFTVAANGTITGTVVVTPSDSSGGGTFTPTTVSISAATPFATFTYTPGSAGAKTISTSNNGGLTNPSSITYTASSGAATAITMSGPSGGSVGAASTNFTVGADGVITGTVVVTPSDTSGGGTFTPTTVSISAGSPTATFTYTPGSAGAKTVSVTNNGSLSNPSAITYTAITTTVIAVDNASLFWTSDNWDFLSVSTFGVSIKSMQTTACGAGVKFQFTGATALTLNLDGTVLSGFGSNTPLLMWTIGSGPAQKAQLTPGATTLSLATGLTAGNTYTCRLYLLGAVETQGDRWGSSGVSPTNVLRINGFTFTGTATVSADPGLLQKRMVFDGDSIVESVRAAGTSTEPLDHGRSSPWFAAQALNAEVGVHGYGAQGWEKTGSGNMPVFTTAWTSHSFGRPRALTGLDYYFVMHGYNLGVNGLTTLQATVQTWLAAARTALGASTWIFVVSNPGGIGAAQCSAAVAAYKTATPSDTKVAFIDLSDRIDVNQFNVVPPNLGTPTYGSIDGVHPLETPSNANIGIAIAQKALAAMGGGTTPSQVLGLSGIGLSATGQLVAML